jgi:hypothetical protein
MNEILRYSVIQERVKVIIHLLQSVKYAELYMNYELIDVIYSVLTNQPIYRLTETFQLIQHSHPHVNDLERFRRLTENCCLKLNQMMLASAADHSHHHHGHRPLVSSPVIPYIEYYRKLFKKSNEQIKVIVLKVKNEQQQQSQQQQQQMKTIQHLKIQSIRTETQALLEIERYQRDGSSYYDLFLSVNRIKGTEGTKDKEIEDEILFQRQILNCAMYPLDEEILDARSYELQPPQVIV